MWESKAGDRAQRESWRTEGDMQKWEKRPPSPPLPGPSGPRPLTQDDELCVGLVVPLEVLGGDHRAVIHTTVPPSRLVKGQVSICTKRRV